MFWKEWRGSSDGRPTMLIRNLVSFRGFKIDLHKFVRADDADCFHTHPATAIRVILAGGYVEEIRNGPTVFWTAGAVGIIRPELCHRIDGLFCRASYSLWIRLPKSAEITIFGNC